MEIYVSEDDLLQNIQDDFSERYPYLRLQFYRNPHQPGMPSPQREKLSLQLPVEEVSMFHKSGIIDVGAQRTVAEVEDDFFRQLSLCVQVQRQSGNLWLETTGTDTWTLQQQNDLGRISHISQQQEQPEDFDLADHE